MFSAIKMKMLFIIILLLLSIQPANATLFVNLDMDLRYIEDEFKVKALGASLRKVFADERGDRIILFATPELMHNFQEAMLEQAYIQYKGPLGRWNLILGRYLLPFGLIPNYSSKRLLINTLEHETIGIRADSGLQILGVVGNFDYAVSLSHGGRSIDRWENIDDIELVTFRIGYQGVDFEDLRIGLSALSGQIEPDKMHNTRCVPAYKNLVAIDLIKYYGPMVWRAELTLGEESDKNLYGLFTGVDYALFPRTDLNLGYTHLNHDGHNKDALTVGLTYNLSGYQIRAAKKLSSGGEQNEFSFQIYRLFSWTL